MEADSGFMGGGQGLGKLSTRIAGAAKWEKIQVHLLPLQTFESSCHSNYIDYLFKALVIIKESI